MVYGAVYYTMKDYSPAAEHTVYYKQCSVTSQKCQVDITCSLGFPSCYSASSEVKETEETV